MPSLAIRGGRVIDPANQSLILSLSKDAMADVLIENGRITAVGPDVGKDAAETIDASGLVVAPGFVDVHTHLREPGFEHKETIETGTLAAARGGFTTICAMPNTNPPMDTAATVEFVLRTAETKGHVRVLPIACVSKGREGRDLAELAELAQAGAVAFSDDGSPVADAHLMRRALEYARMLGVPVIDHCEDPALAAGGVMHEGWVSARLGLRGVPAAAEEAIVARDIALAEEIATNHRSRGFPASAGHVHIAHISTAGSVALVRAAKARGAPVTAEVTPHHLALTHDAVLLGPGETPGGLAYDTNAKVNPPLRAQADAEACIAGLLDGTIDCIATDHAPHAGQDKFCEFDIAAFGISGLETAFALSKQAIEQAGKQDLLLALVERLTTGPVRTLGLDSRTPDLGTLNAGAPADIVLIDPEAEWVVEPETFASKGRNTPLAGRTLKGRVVMTLSDGSTVWRA